MAENAIQIRGLRKEYGELTALDGIDLAVPPGQFFGLLGPNGAGKTSTINVLSGLCVKTDGDVTLHGKDLVRDYRACRRLVGLVPQEFNFDQFIRVRKMLTYQGGFFGLPQKECETRADELLETFELADKQDNPVRQLSGGMKRRAIIARALMHRPRILILDEPTAGVDVDLRRSLWRFLRTLNGDGTTIMLTTHYIEEAEALCDRIAIIRQGRIIADDATHRLANQLSSESLIISTEHPVPERALQALTAFSPRLGGDGTELTLSFDRTAHPYEEVLAQVVSAKLGITHLRPADNRLEQVFLKLTAESEGA